MNSSENVKMDFFEFGDKTSLVCVDPGTAETVQQALRDLGFKLHTAETSEMATERIRYTAYDCIVVHETFAGSSLRSNAVVNYLASLPMSQRRYSFVCLIGPSFKTMDAMQAFAQSVHLVVNPDELRTLTAILRKGLSEFEQLHAIYKDVAQAAR